MLSVDQSQFRLCLLSVTQIKAIQWGRDCAVRWNQNKEMTSLLLMVGFVRYGHMSFSTHELCGYRGTQSLDIFKCRVHA